MSSNLAPSPIKEITTRCSPEFLRDSACFSFYSDKPRFSLRDFNRADRGDIFTLPIFLNLSRLENRDATYWYYDRTISSTRLSLLGSLAYKSDDMSAMKRVALFVVTVSFSIFMFSTGLYSTFPWMRGILTTFFLLGTWGQAGMGLETYKVTVKTTGIKVSDVDVSPYEDTRTYACDVLVPGVGEEGVDKVDVKDLIKEMLNRPIIRNFLPVLKEASFAEGEDPKPKLKLVEKQLNAIFANVHNFSLSDAASSSIRACWNEDGSCKEDAWDIFTNSFPRIVSNELNLKPSTIVWYYGARMTA